MCLSKATFDFTFDGNSNARFICHHFRDFRNRNVNNLDLHLQNWPRSNVNMSVERLHATFYVLVIIMFFSFVIVCEIFTFELLNVINSNLWPWKWSQKRWRFVWKLAFEFNVDVHTCMSKWVLLGPAVCSRWLFVTYIHTQRLFA